MADFFERILNNKPDLLRELLDESMFDTDSVSRLTSVMQESVLVRILLLMCPNDQVKTVIYSDLLVVAFIDAQKSLGIQVDSALASACSSGLTFHVPVLLNHASLRAVGAQDCWGALRCATSTCS